jgi:F-type H+-transporting ATPase subunit a
MGELGRIHQLIIPVFGYSMTFNLEVILMTWIAFLVILVLGLSGGAQKGHGTAIHAGVRRTVRFQSIPTDRRRPGQGNGKKYGPLICALFHVSAGSNWLGIVPHLEEPTKDLNTPLSLGVMGFVIAHVAGIRKKGFKNMPTSIFSQSFSWPR